MKERIRRICDRLISPDVREIDTHEGHLTLIGLFVPLFVEQLLMHLMGTVNTLVLSHYSDGAVAAVGAANQVVSLFYTVFSMISGGASVVISHRLGAGNEEAAGDASFTAILSGFAMSFACGLVLRAFAVPLMTMLNLEGSVLEMAEQYFRICISFAFLQGTMNACSATLRSYGRPKVAVVASILMNALNAVLNMIVIYAPSLVPLHGVEGIAAANVISRACALAVLLIYLARCDLPLNFRTKKLTALRSLKNILHIGIPAGVSTLSYSLSQVVSTSILGLLGQTALSAKIYVSTVVFYVYVIGYSLGLTIAIMIGWIAGSGDFDRAVKLNHQSLRLAVSINMILSAVIWIFGRQLIGLFTSDPDILAMVPGILAIDFFVEIGRGFNHIEENSLRGAGDAVFPMVISVASCWGISILFSWILGIQAHLGLYGCWIAFMMDELFRGISYLCRFNSKKWTRMVV